MKIGLFTMGCFKSIEHVPGETYKYLIVPSPSLVPEDLRFEDKLYVRRQVNSTVGNKVITLTVLTQGHPASKFESFAQRLLYVRTDAFIILASGDNEQDFKVLNTRIKDEISNARVEHHLSHTPVYIYVISQKLEECKNALQTKELASREAWFIKFMPTIESLESEFDEVTAELSFTGIPPNPLNDSMKSEVRLDKESERLDRDFDQYIINKRKAQDSRHNRASRVDEPNHPEDLGMSHLGGQGKLSPIRPSIFEDRDDQILLKKVNKTQAASYAYMDEYK